MTQELSQSLTQTLPWPNGTFILGYYKQAIGDSISLDYYTYYLMHHNNNAKTRSPALIALILFL